MNVCVQIVYIILTKGFYDHYEELGNPLPPLDGLKGYNHSIHTKIGQKDLKLLGAESNIPRRGGPCELIDCLELFTLYLAHDISKYELTVARPNYLSSWRYNLTTHYVP